MLAALLITAATNNLRTLSPSANFRASFIIVKAFCGLREQVYGNNNYGPGKRRSGGSSAAGAQRTVSLPHTALSWS